MDTLIKWSGSKRKQSPIITSNIYKEYRTYYEPFCGSCAVLAYILEHYANKFKNFICSDLNADLINSYNLVKSNPDIVISQYDKMWNELNNEKNSLNDKKIYFNVVRDRLNKYHDPVDFIFIMRTTVNGMPRYNTNGDFNNSFHVTRNGIIPSTFSKIIKQWHLMLNKHNVQFICQSYNKINPDQNDFVYFDPPYAHVKGMYFG